MLRIAGNSGRGNKASFFKYDFLQLGILKQ